MDEKQLKLKKEAEEKKKKAEEKHWFEVRVETNVPATVYYKILAKDAEEAASLVKNSPIQRVEYKIRLKRDIKLSVYEVGMLIIKYMKQLGRQ